MNYEIHITVSVDPAAPELEKFKSICETLDVKAIVIDAYPLTDVMTSFRIQSEDQNYVFALMNAQCRCLEAEGFRVLRSKVETDLTHPHVTTPLPNQYFESHVQVKLSDAELQSLRELREGIDFHISSNAFKPVEDGKHIRMVTVREYYTTADKFTRRVTALRNVLKAEGFELAKDLEIEFALYDSNAKHDKPWIEAR